MKTLSKLFLLIGFLFLITNCKKEEDKYELSLTSNLENAGELTGEGSYNHGDQINITATPNSGYSFSCWTEDITIVSETANFIYTIPSRNVTLKANFIKETSLNLLINKENAGIVTGSGSYIPNSKVNIKATANPGYVFHNWTQGSTLVSQNPNFTYTITTENSTLTANFYAILTLQPDATSGKDAYLNNYHPDINYGTHSDFAAIAWTTSGTSSVARGIIKFDLSSLPAGAIIQSALLSLYGYNSSANGAHSGSNSSIIQRVTGSWDESTVTWNNQPSSTSTDEVILPQSTYVSQNFLDIEVTKQVKYMVENPSQNYGFLIKLAVETEYRKMIFASSDNANSSLHPKIVITYL